MSTDDLMDCGDSSCQFALKKTGMRTNGGCRCLLGERSGDMSLELARKIRRHHNAMKSLVAERAALDELRGMAGMGEVQRMLRDKLLQYEYDAGGDYVKQDVRDYMDALAALLRMLGGET